MTFSVIKKETFTQDPLEVCAHRCRGLGDDSAANEGTSVQTLEFHSWNPHAGIRELTPQGCPMTFMCTSRHLYIKIQ